MGNKSKFNLYMANDLRTGGLDRSAFVMKMINVLLNDYFQAFHGVQKNAKERRGGAGERMPAVVFEMKGGCDCSKERASKVAKLEVEAMESSILY